jgi:nicotinate-nucleotide adenylyltransferase
LEKLGGKVSILDVCPPDVSSTGIRNLNLYGMPIDGLVASATEKYIKENSLYVFNGYMEPQFFDKCIKFREKYENLVTLLKERLTEKRFYHTLCVAKEAVRLAEKYGADAEKVFLAGLLHDICKDMSGKSQLQLFKEFGIILDSVVLGAPKLWHSYLGAEYIKNVLDINDTEIINAVRYHTTARANMSLTEKIIYLADFTSEERTYDGVEDMRKAVDISIEKAMYDALLFSVEDLKEKGATVHPDTLAAYREAKSIYLK